MLNLLKRLRLETEDRLRYHPLIRNLLSRYHRWRALRKHPRDDQALARTILRGCTAARITTRDETASQIQADLIERVRRLDPARLDWNEFVPEIENPHLAKAAILKPWVGPREKGVVFISFESQWAKLLRLPNLTDFAERYSVVLSPSSSPHNFVNYVFPAMYPDDTIFTLLSNPEDQLVLPRISPKFVVVPLYASNWVNPARFAPLPKGERPYDLLMVANFAKFKRHQAFFKALRHMPRDLRILLIGQHQDGRTEDTILNMADWYGVRDRFTLLTNQPYQEMTRHFCRARAGVVLSRREGSCVVVTESFFADTPFAVLRGAELGSRVFVNDQTGRFLDEANLARDLTAFVRAADHYHPRAWAEANISCHVSSRRLNASLKDHALNRGAEWTRDLATLEWAPDPRLVNAEDRVWEEDEKRSVRARFGLEIGPSNVK